MISYLSWRSWGTEWSSNLPRFTEPGGIFSRPIISCFVLATQLQVWTPRQLHSIVSKPFLSGSLQSSDCVLVALLRSLWKVGMGWVPMKLQLHPQPQDASPNQAADPHFSFLVEWRLASSSFQQSDGLGLHPGGPRCGQGALLQPWNPAIYSEDRLPHCGTGPLRY